MSVIELNCSPSCHNLSQMTQWSLPLSNNIGIFSPFLKSWACHTPSATVPCSRKLHFLSSGHIYFQKAPEYAKLDYFLDRFAGWLWANEIVSASQFNTSKKLKICHHHTRTKKYAAENEGGSILFIKRMKRKYWTFPMLSLYCFFTTGCPNLFFSPSKTAFQNLKTHICTRSLET